MKNPPGLLILAAPFARVAGVVVPVGVSSHVFYNGHQVGIGKGDPRQRIEQLEARIAD
jgi:hypothetical protein